MAIPDDDTCYRAVHGKDARFDGWFFTAVRSTGIYCRPSCPARTPLRRNVTFYPSAAAAQRAGYRACKRCRPDAAPGSPDWDVRGDLAARAMRLIADGLIDREGVPGLARRLGYSERQLQRTLVAEVGAGPLALARAQRAQTARVLLETTDLPAADVAFAAGFSSVRQFNESMNEIFACSPTQLRARGAKAPAGNGAIELRLAYRAPMRLEATLNYLAARAVPEVETYVDGVFTRALRLPNGFGRAELSAAPGPSDHYVMCRLFLADQRDLVSAVSRLRGLLDLDADPTAIDAELSTDPRLAALVARRPGLRSPGTVDAAEMMLRAIVGQQISVAGARTVLGRIVAELGDQLGDQLGDPLGAVAKPDRADGRTWRVFPSAETLSTCDPAQLPMPRARALTVQRVAQALADGELVLDQGADREQARATLLGLRGIGPWTADYLLMRVLGDPDVLLASDLIVKRSADRLGLDLAAAAKSHSPWGSYLSHHLWSAAHDVPAEDSEERGESEL